MLIVVRHAVAVERGRWPGDDLSRPLTGLGERQAEGLLIRLEDFPVERILSSAAVRCLDTVAPLARQRLVPVETVEPLGLAGTTEGLLDLVARDDVEDAVLCTHGEVIGALLVALLSDGRLDADPGQWPKGSVWLLQRLGNGRIAGHYLPPLTYDPALWPAPAHTMADRP